MDLLEKVIKEVEEQEDTCKIGERRDAYVQRVMTLVAPVVKSWYLKTSVKYLNEKQYKEGEEDILADFTDFCTDMLDEIVEQRNYSRNPYPAFIAS